MNRPRSKVSTEEIIAELKRIAKDIGKTPTWSQFMDLSNIPPSRIVKCFGTYNKALEAAEIPVNRKGSRSKSNKPRQYAATIRHNSNKFKGRTAVITLRSCNMCERPFKAEDDMRSCPACTITKRGIDRRGGISDSRYGIGYLT